MKASKPRKEMCREVHEITRHSRIEELPTLLTAEEVGCFLGLSMQSIYLMLRSGDLEHRRYGRMIRIPRTALEGLPVV